jgi:cysteinyl-tRNA synthetase
MGKSLGNFITLDQLFSGEHPALKRAYPPATVRFFILQAHYRSPLDFSNDALEAAGKGLERLLAALAALDKVAPSEEDATTTGEVERLTRDCLAALDDDLNTPVLLACLFDGTRLVYNIASGSRAIDAGTLERLKRLYREIIHDVLGLEAAAPDDTRVLGEVIDVLMNVRREARQNKDWATSDRIRDELSRAGIAIKDTKEGYEWHVDKR